MLRYYNGGISVVRQVSLAFAASQRVWADTYFHATIRIERVIKVDAYAQHPVTSSRRSFKAAMTKLDRKVTTAEESNRRKHGDNDTGSSIIPVHDLGFSVSRPLTQLVDESPIRNAKELREIFELAPENGTSIKKAIQEKTKECLVRNRASSGLKGGKFLPINILDLILGVESIRSLIQEEYCHSHHSQVTRKDIDSKLDIYLSRRRILGILLYMHPEDLRLFHCFVNENITDEDLPLTSMGTDDVSFRTRRERENTTMFKEWDYNDITLFYCYQPIFIAPFFDIQEKRLCNYVLDEAIQLPWLNYELKTRGGNGMVHRVEIHPSHHNFRPLEPLKSPLYFALKEIPTLDEDTYRHELLALDKSCAQMQKEKHLIKLLLTFQHGRKYYFLFEWADGNLWDYWNRYPGGSEDVDVNSVWMAEQCLGLATAVKRIHGLSTWQKERRSRLGAMTEEEKEWGRHGDVKPHNILWFSYRTEGCFLVLSDLGLTRYHSSVTRSLVSPTSLDGCTELYRPPEMDMPGRHICSKYDIWPLGCVFLEFCTWWLRGFKSVQYFESQRASSDDSMEMVQDPKYFFISETQGSAKPHVKCIVTEWIKDLRGDAKGDLFVEPMLDLIENGMLVVDKEDRFAADLVCAEILDILVRLREADTNSALAPGNSSNDDTADEACYSPMTPASIASDSNPLSKNETDIRIPEWHVDDAMFTAMNE